MGEQLLQPRQYKVNVFFFSFRCQLLFSLSRFGHFHDGNGSIVPPILTLERYVSSFWNSKRDKYVVKGTETYTETFSLTQSDLLGPFTKGNSDEVDMKLLQSTRSAIFVANVLSLNVGPLGAIPYQWMISTKYDFVHGTGSCNVELFTQVTETQKREIFF